MIPSDKSADSRRIARNTLFLYIRMIVMTLVTLYTFRKLLELLGVENYGIYNVIGGVIILFSFISTAITQSHQRFLAYEIGKGSEGDVTRLFSMMINTQLVIVAILVAAAETAGLYFINHELNFGSESMGVVNCVYQFTIITFVFQIMQIPLTSAIIAYERMDYFSYASIGEALIRLGVVLSLALFPTGRLQTYAILLSASALLILSIYALICKVSFSSIRYARQWNSRMFRKLIGFSGWNMLGGFGNVATDQGLNILFNIFCNLTVNAAMGVANQINAAIGLLVTNIQTAFNPQIIKSFANHDSLYFNSLTFRCARISFYLMATVGAPLIVCMPGILNLWLADVPEYSIPFARIFIVYFLIDAISGSLFTAIQACGKIRRYMTVFAMLTLLNLPIAYLLLSGGISPVAAIGMRAFINLIVLNYRILYLKTAIAFPAAEFYRDVALPALSLSVTALLFALLMHYAAPGFAMQQWATGILMVPLMLTAGFRIMLQPGEREFIVNTLKSKIIKRRL